MSEKLKFLIVDDDEASINIHTRLLKKAGHSVSVIQSTREALIQIEKDPPDCVLCDLSMPDHDGLDLFKQVKLLKKIKKPTFIIITAKHFEFDRRRANKAGVDGYLTKPVDPATFADDILEIINSTICIQFWGVRGTLPVPGRKTVRYGGNTNCVTLNFAKRCLLIFDAGTGIKELSNHLMKQNHFPLTAHIFISHPHYDHIHGLPFFVPLYMQGNEFEILGTDHGETSLEKLISDQMDSVYFPVTTKEFGSMVKYHSLNEEKFKLDNLEIETILLNHPGRCLGYKVQYKNKSFCYLTDNELYLKSSPFYNESEIERLIKFITNIDVLVIDSTYSDEEYSTKLGWGHSSISRVVDIADIAKVKLLCLYHHDPDQYDKDIDAKLKHAKAMLKSRNSKTRCIAPKEGDKIRI